MIDETKPGADTTDVDDDRYVLEDTSETVEGIEREMELADRQHAAAASGPPQATQDLESENRQLRDRYMRALADFENFRKRSEREKADFFRYALSGIIKDLLPVVDNFDRALEHAAEGDEFHKGILLIEKQLFDVLQKHGLKPVEEAGVRFDPNLHEAIVREEDASVPSQTVVAILQKGYFLDDRLLRPALVKVAVGGPESS